MKRLILLSFVLYTLYLFAGDNVVGDYVTARKTVNATDSVVTRMQVLKKISYFPSIYITRPGTIINYKDSGLYRFTGASWLKIGTDTSSLSHRIDLKINKVDSTGSSSGNYVTRKALRDTVNYALTGKLTNKGNYDASVNQWPTGTIHNGDWYTISVKGYANPDSLRVGDIITAKVDNPGQTNSNWNIITHGSTIYANSGLRMDGDTVKLHLDEYGRVDFNDQDIQIIGGNTSALISKGRIQFDEANYNSSKYSQFSVDTVLGIRAQVVGEGEITAYYLIDKGLGIDVPHPTEKIDVNGNIKADTFKGVFQGIYPQKAGSADTGTLKYNGRTPADGVFFGGHGDDHYGYDSLSFGGSFHAASNQDNGIVGATIGAGKYGVTGYSSNGYGLRGLGQIGAIILGTTNKGAIINSEDNVGAEIVSSNNNIIATFVGKKQPNSAVVAQVDSNGYYYGNSPHAISQFIDSSVILSLTQNVWYQITNQWKSLWPSTEYYGFTESADTVIAGFKGDFIYNNEVNLLGVNTKDYEYRIMRRRNNVNTVVWKYQITSGGQKVLREINSYIEDAQIGDRYWIELRSTSLAPGSVTIYGGRMRFTALHLDIE